MEEEEVNKKINYIEDLNKIKSSNMLIEKSLKKFFSLNNFRNNYITYIVFIIISIALVALFRFQDNKLDMLINIVTYINDVIMVLLGVVFAGYTLFQTSLGSKLLKTMIFTPAKTKSKSQKNISSRYVVLNESFFELMALYIFGFVINFVVFLFLNTGNTVISKLYNNYSLCMQAIFFVYISFYLSIFWEIKFFIFNIYSLINTSVAFEGIKMFEEEIEKNEQEKSKK